MKSNTRLVVPTRAYCFPITERTLTRSVSVHFIAFNAGETTAVVKTTPPSHTPARITCSVWTATFTAASSGPWPAFHLWASAVAQRLLVQDRVAPYVAHCHRANQ